MWKDHFLSTSPVVTPDTLAAVIAWAQVEGVLRKAAPDATLISFTKELAPGWHAQAPASQEPAPPPHGKGKGGKGKGKGKGKGGR